MLKETGRVVALEGDSVWVETLRQTSCGSCSAKAGCGHGMLNEALPGSSRGVVKARLAHDQLPPLALHDEVEISLPERGFLRAASMLYAVPILATVAGALLADRFVVAAGATQATADLQVTVASVLGLAVGLVYVRFSTRHAGASDGLLPRVTGKV